MTTNLLEKLAADETAENEKLLAEYRLILGRADKPRANDAKRLKEIMPLIGLDVERVKRHLEAMQKHAELTLVAAGLADAETQSAEAGLAYSSCREKHEAEIRRFDELERDLHGKMTSARNRRDGAKRAAEGLVTLERQTPLLWPPAPAPEATGLVAELEGVDPTTPDTE